MSSNKNENSEKVLLNNDENEFLCDNPISIDEIERGLWLGSFTAATDLVTLKQRNITHILTLDICPLPTHITEIPYLTTKYVHVSDTPKDDMLGYFEECCDFIENALAAKNSILVHCYYGVSRSATIVIAYIMRKYKISTTPAMERVKAKRIYVRPNSGFTTQLRLFHKMGWKIDTAHEKYKVYRMKLAADKVRKAKILPQTCMDLVKPDPGLVQSNPEPNVYRCKKCRRVVAAKSNVLTHQRANLVKPQTADKPIIATPTTTTAAIVHVNVEATTATNAVDPFQSSTMTCQQSAKDLFPLKSLVDKFTTQLHLNTIQTQNSEQSSDDPDDRCRDIVFVEPLAWMANVSKQTQGKLNCPKCQSKLGNFTWINGCNCPCGKNVAPAFYLVPSKVELTRSVQNVEMTV